MPLRFNGGWRVKLLKKTAWGISVGHLISLPIACDWVLRLSPHYRLPETTRQADQMVRRLKKASRGN